MTLGRARVLNLGTYHDLLRLEGASKGAAMATIFMIECTSGDAVASLEIIDSWNPLPGSDEWRCLEGTAVFGLPASGHVGSWGANYASLHAGAATIRHTLDEFTKSTEEGDFGSGEKAMTGGTFPDGRFEWRCLSKN